MVKKLPLFLILLMFLLAGNLQAQNPLFKKWTRQELVKGGRIDAIADLGNGIVVAGTRKPNPGKIFRSKNFGKTWNLIQNISDTSGLGSITCIAMGKNKTAYLLTAEGAFWRSRNNGICWKYINTIRSIKIKMVLLPPIR